MVLGTLLLIVILVVVGVFFYSEITAIVDDYSTIISQTLRDNEFKIPTPTRGETVCDLAITINVRSFSAISGDIISHNRILFTDGKEGKLIGWNWDNCKTYVSNLFSVSLLDTITRSDFTTLEFFIPDSSPFDQKIILSYALVDETNLKIKKPIYQRVEYIHPSFQTIYDFQEQIKFYQIIPKDYTLEITPLESHFEDLKVGEPLKKTITFTE